MHHGSTFKTVETIGRTLPDREVTTTYGKPALKMRGKMFVCGACVLMGIDVIDHVALGDVRYWSFKEAGRL